MSAKDGRGLDDLLAALERAAGRAEAGRRAGPARLPVDRVFPLKGIGTVVTGTLWSGEIRAGDAVVVEPGGARAAVRSVQVHDHEAEVVHAGSRAGVNLRGLDRDDVGRGDWLVAPELAGASGRRFDAWVSVLPGRAAASLGRPGAAASRHGAVPRPRGAARGPGDHAGYGGRGRRAAGRGRAACCRTTASSSARSRRSPPSPAARRSWPARSAGTRGSGTAPFSPRCAAAMRGLRSRRSRQTAATPA